MIKKYLTDTILAEPSLGLSVLNGKIQLEDVINRILYRAQTLYPAVLCELRSQLSTNDILRNIVGESIVNFWYSFFFFHFGLLVVFFTNKSGLTNKHEYLTICKKKSEQKRDNPDEIKSMAKATRKRKLGQRDTDQKESEMAPPHKKQKRKITVRQRPSPIATDSETTAIREKWLQKLKEVLGTFCFVMNPINIKI